MAKINGLEIKRVHAFRGHEGEPCFQGNLYLNGKKIATWSNSYSMGPNDYEFESGYSETKLNQLMEDTYGKDKYPLNYDLDLLIDDLLELRELEKSYKRQLKNVQAPVLAAVCHKYKFAVPYHFQCLASWFYNYKKGVKQASDETIADAVLEASQSHGVKINDSNAIVTIFRSLDDFIFGEPFKLQSIQE